MNPNASEWKPSVSAAPWNPGQGFQVSTSTATATATPSPAPAAPPPPASPDRQETSESEIDENDPLWKAVLKVAQGDREKALQMIDDPDSLTQYPEVEAVLAAGGTTDDVAEAPETAPEIISQEQTRPTIEENADEEEETTDAVALTEGDPREHLNLVFIGHVDAGKSTLSGNILYLTGNVDKRTIERYEREAKDLNRESWFLAFIMDTNEEERAKGITVEVGKAPFSTDVKRYTILDAPGHKNYVSNMIMGACQADVGVLVISARRGEFEAGFDKGGQTREHALLCKTLGVSYLIVAVNKMDEPTVQWSKDRYDECVKRIRPFLFACGFVIKREVKFIPISGLNGANVKEEVSESACSWWKKSWQNGENNTNKGTLLSLLDSLEIEGRDPTAPLRIPVLDRYADRGTIAMGKVESGVVRPGMKVTVMPTRNQYKVDAVWADDDRVSVARPGENVLIKLTGAGTEDVRQGYVLCTEPLCRVVNKIICQMTIVDMPDNLKIITAGFQCIFYAQCCEEECTVTKIFETKKKGQVVKGARFASVGMECVCMLELERASPVETFDTMPFLGRFTLRTEGKTIAINGKIIKLPPKKA